VAGLPPSPAASELIGVMTGMVVGSCSREGAGVFVPGEGLALCRHPAASGCARQSGPPVVPVCCALAVLFVSCARETPAQSRSRERTTNTTLILSVLFKLKLPLQVLLLLFVSFRDQRRPSE
jgi:hypothetical protein